MTDTVNAVVKPGHSVRHEIDGAEVVSTASDGVVKMSKQAFDEAEKFGSVRRSTKEDREAAKAADDQVAQAGQPPAEPSVEQRAAAVDVSQGAESRKGVRS